MRVAHIADVHLGYRSTRLTPEGVNQRETMCFALRCWLMSRAGT